MRSTDDIREAFSCPSDNLRTCYQTRLPEKNTRRSPRCELHHLRAPCAPATPVQLPITPSLFPQYVDAATRTLSRLSNSVVCLITSSTQHAEHIRTCSGKIFGLSHFLSSHRSLARLRPCIASATGGTGDCAEQSGWDIRIRRGSSRAGGDCFASYNLSDLIAQPLCVSVRLRPTVVRWLQGYISAAPCEG